jgi:MSHA biogenesis protein MshK
MAQRLILAISLLPAAAALAQGLADPTRPPSLTEAAPAAATTQGPASRLQSVLISSGRKVAVIDGRTVRLGERVGDATLVAVGPARVVLQKGAEYQTLKLHPGIEKKP